MVAAASVNTVIGKGIQGFTDDGPVSDSAAIAEPFGVVASEDGSLYFCDLGNHRVRRLDAGTLTTVAGTGRLGTDRTATNARGAAINEPYEIRIHASGDLYFVDMKNHVVQRVDDAGKLHLVAGNGVQGFSGDGGPALEAQLDQPHSIEFDGRDGLLIADIGNHRIRRVDLNTGSIATFAGTGNGSRTIDGIRLDEADLFGPRAIALAGNGDLYLALREGNAVYRIDMSTRRIHHVAGNGSFGYDPSITDPRQAPLAGPKGIALDGSGRIVIADTESHTVRRIDPRRGRIETLLGTGDGHDGPDGNPLTCGLARPHGVFVTPSGDVLVGDTDNHRIRVLSGV